MKLGRRHLIFALAFLAWGACVVAVLGIAGSAWGACRDSIEGHGSTGCRKDVELLLWAFTLTVLIGGAWLLKRFAARIGIDLD